MRDKVLVIGSLNYDTILKMSKQPELGETLPVNEVAFSAGGKGANQAVQAAKLGMETYMMGCVGNDYMGDFLVKTAEKYGVHTEFVRKIDGTSGMGIVNALDDGGVFASIVRGANFEVSKEDIDKTEMLLNEVGMVVLQMEIPQEINRYAIKKAKEYGCKILLNAAPAAPLEDEYMKLCDILVVNEVEASFYMGQPIDSMEKAESAADTLSGRFENTCIITMGKEGAVVSDGNTHEQIPSMKVNAIETTGAGDSFIGGVAYAVMQGMTIFDACRFATKCSAVTVCRLGAQDSMPVLSEISR